MTPGRKIAFSIAVAAVLAALASALIAKLNGPDGVGWHVYPPDSSDTSGSLRYEGEAATGHWLRTDRRDREGRSGVVVLR